MDIVGGLKSLGKIVEFVMWAYDRVAYSVKYVFYKTGVMKINRKKKEVEDADTPDDWVDIIN